MMDDREGMMKKPRQRYRITVVDGGLEIRPVKGSSLRFTAAEALMLLDILKNEEKKLKLMAAQASPMSVRMQL